MIHDYSAQWASWPLLHPGLNAMSAADRAALAGERCEHGYHSFCPICFMSLRASTTLPVDCVIQAVNKIRACFGTVGSGREACQALLMYAEEVEADGYQIIASIVRQAAFEAAQHPLSKK